MVVFLLVVFRGVDAGESALAGFGKAPRAADNSAGDVRKLLKFVERIGAGRGPGGKGSVEGAVKPATIERASPQVPDGAGAGVPLPCFDCQAAPLACDGVANDGVADGTLAPDDCSLGESRFGDFYTIELFEWHRVEFRLDSDAFDTRLELRDANCELIAESVECEPGDGSLSCLAMTLTNGFYYLVATSAAGGATGAYSLSATCQPVDVFRECVIADVHCGDTVRRNGAESPCISNAGFLDVYTLHLDEPQELSIALSSVEFDTVLIIGDLSTFFILNDDCGLGNTDSCISDVFAAGDYFISVGPFDVDQEGNYELSVGCAQPQPCTECVVGEIAFGTSTAGTLAPGDCERGSSFFDVYDLQVTEPSTVTISLDSDGLDPYLILFDEACTSLAENDDCDFSLNSCITANLAPGTYRVGVTDFWGDSGAYELSVRDSQGDSCTDCVVGAASCGSVAGELTADDCLRGGRFSDLYDLNLSVPTEVTIELNSDQFDCYLTLLGEQCTPMQENDDCDANLNSCITASLPPGTYRIGVTTFSSGERGTYDLTLTSSPDCDPPTEEWRPGDCNIDGTVDLTDAVCLLRFLFDDVRPDFPCAQTPPSPDVPLEPGPGDVLLLDWDGSGRLNLTDTVALLNYLFLNGPPHALGRNCVSLPACGRRSPPPAESCAGNP